MKGMWIEWIKRKTHMKEMNEQILLSLIMSGSKIGVMELCWTVRRTTIVLLKRILGSLELKGKSSATSLSCFCLTAKLNQQCLNLLPLLLMIMPSCLVLVPLPMKRTVPSTSGLVKNEIAISAAPLFILRQLWLQDGKHIPLPMWCIRPWRRCVDVADQADLDLSANESQRYHGKDRTFWGESLARQHLGRSSLWWRLVGLHGSHLRRTMSLHWGQRCIYPVGLGWVNWEFWNNLPS